MYFEDDEEEEQDEDDDKEDEQNEFIAGDEERDDEQEFDDEVDAVDDDEEVKSVHLETFDDEFDWIRGPFSYLDVENICWKMFNLPLAVDGVDLTLEFILFFTFSRKKVTWERES